MTKYYLFLFSIVFTVNAFSQRIVNNPDCISSNINGRITKVELSEKETVLHFYVEAPIGSWIAIPKKTYIEDSFENNGKLYITKTEGIKLTGKVFIEDSEELRYKLFFPPLPKNVKKINYGESNKYGNWFIYKSDLTKDGVDFLNSPNRIVYNAVPSVKSSLPKVISRGINTRTLANKDNLLPEELPKNFFGDWYDKYGTLLLVTTANYIVLDSRIQFYQDIKRISDTRFVINLVSGGFEILSLDSESMTLRTNKLINLTKNIGNEENSKDLVGYWHHSDEIKEIQITEENFYQDDKGTTEYCEVQKFKIDHIAKSQSSNKFWIVLYAEGVYKLYIVNKTKDGFILTPRGYANEKYKKMKNRSL